MIRHVALFQFKPDTPQTAVDELEAALRRLPEVVRGIHSTAFGANIGDRPDNFHFASTVDFDSMESYIEYRESQAHRDLAENYVIPILADRAGIQFQFDL
jgi:hypothetical protein